MGGIEEAALVEAGAGRPDGIAGFTFEVGGAIAAGAAEGGATARHHRAVGIINVGKPATGWIGRTAAHAGFAERQDAAATAAKLAITAIIKEQWHTLLDRLACGRKGGAAIALRAGRFGIAGSTTGLFFGRLGAGIADAEVAAAIGVGLAGFAKRGQTVFYADILHANLADRAMIVTDTLHAPTGSKVAAILTEAAIQHLAVRIAAGDIAAFATVALGAA